MYVAGTMSWQIQSRPDNDLTLALFVRDVAGLGRFVAALPDIGELEPPPPHHHPLGHFDLTAAVRRWPHWWNRILHGPAEQQLSAGWPDWNQMDDLPDVAALAEQHLENFEAWIAPIVREIAATDVHDTHLSDYVSDYEDRLGRTVNPFTSRLRLLPLRDADGWVINDQQVVASHRLLCNRRAIESLLNPVLEAVAWLRLIDLVPGRLSSA